MRTRKLTIISLNDPLLFFSFLNQGFPEQPLKNLLLSASEEQTERCFIVEDLDTVSAEETNQTDQDHRTYSSQTSQDSGHYSNEDENSGGSVSVGPGRLEPGSGLRAEWLECEQLTRGPEPLASAGMSRDLLVGEETSFHRGPESTGKHLTCLQMKPQESGTGLPQPFRV